LKLSMISNLPVYVRGDSVRLRQIIDNVLSNAIKFTPAPGIIAVRLRAEEGTASISISSNG
jgi:signal transduction histidine kinase